MIADDGFASRDVLCNYVSFRPFDTLCLPINDVTPTPEFYKHRRSNIIGNMPVGRRKFYWQPDRRGTVRITAVEAWDAKTYGNYLFGLAKAAKTCSESRSIHCQRCS